MCYWPMQNAALFAQLPMSGLVRPQKLPCAVKKRSALCCIILHYSALLYCIILHYSALYCIRRDIARYRAICKNRCPAVFTALSRDIAPFYNAILVLQGITPIKKRHPFPKNARGVEVQLFFQRLTALFLPFPSGFVWNTLKNVKKP